MSSIVSTLVNISCNLIGVGFLALPHFFASIGFMQGVALLFIAGISQCIAAIILSHSLADQLSSSSFSEIAVKLKSTRLKCIMEGCLVVQMLANLVISAIVVADASPILSRDLSAGLGLTVATFLSLATDLHNFRFSSIASLVAAIAMLVAVALADRPDESGPHEATWNFVVASKAWGCCLFAFSFAINVPRLTLEIPRKDRKRLNLLFTISVAAAFAFYVAFAAAALRITSQPQPNFILGLSGNFSFYLRALLVLSTIAKMPLSSHPAREILKNYFPVNSSILTSFLYLSAFFIFRFSGNLAAGVSLVGACGSLAASFLFPGLLLRMRASMEPLLAEPVKAGEMHVMDFMTVAAILTALPGLIF